MFGQNTGGGMFGQSAGGGMFGQSSGGGMFGKGLSRVGCSAERQQVTANHRFSSVLSFLAYAVRSFVPLSVLFCAFKL
eukprot:1872829-Amphidinium_carterae.1